MKSKQIWRTLMGVLGPCVIECPILPDTHQITQSKTWFPQFSEFTCIVGAFEGPRFCISVCATLRSTPHRHQCKFFGAHVCKVTFKHLLQPHICHMQSFGTIGKLFSISPPFYPPKNGIVWGEEGTSYNFWVVES